MAAAKGDAMAMRNLSKCYRVGDGVAESARWADHWLPQTKRFG